MAIYGESEVSEVRGQQQERTPVQQGKEPQGCMSEELKVVQQCEGSLAFDIWKSFQIVCEWEAGTEALPVSRLPLHVHIPV